jgi:hypothetical protein
MTIAIHINSRALDFDAASITPAHAERIRLLRRLDGLRVKLDRCDWQSGELLLRRAVVCLELDRRQEAVSMLQRALFLDRDNTLARARLAELCSEDEICDMQLPTPARPLSQDWCEPFRWPLQGEGRWLLGVGAACFAPVIVVLDLVSSYGVFGALLWVPVSLVLIGFVAEYFGSIVRSTVADHPHAPDWPLWDLGQYVLAIQLICALAVLLMPAIFWGSLAEGLATSLPAIYWVGLVALSIPVLVLLPMFMLIFAVRKSLSDAFNPRFIIHGIRAAGREYRTVLGIWSLAVYGTGALVYLASFLEVFGLALCTPLMLYALMVSGRSLGMLYQSRREVLE